MTPSVNQSGNGGESLSWEERIALEMDEETAVACIRGIRDEDRARKVLGLCNEHGVGGSRKEVVVERIGELSD